MDFGSQKRRTFLAKSVLTGSCLLTSTGTAIATNQVTVDQNDSAAYDTIQEAVQAAPDGATINVENGTYNEQVWIPSSKQLTLSGDTGDDTPGAGPNAPVLDGEGETEAAGVSLENDETAPELTIEGFVIRNYGQDLHSPDGPIDEWGGGIKSGYRSNVTIRDVSIDHIAGAGIEVNNDGRATSQNWTVERCWLDSIAHTAIRLSSVVDATIKNNTVTASDPVSDAEGHWWEQNTPDGHPVYGIKVAAAASNGHTTASRNVVIEGNNITGRFDSAGIKLFSHNYGGTQTLAEQITIRNNTVELADAGDSSIEPNEKHGIIVSTNPGPNWLPAAIRDVRIEGNMVIGANHAYKFNAMSPFTAVEQTRGGIRNVVCRNNEAINCSIGCIPLTLRRGNLADVTIEANHFEHCDPGILLWSRGRTLSTVEIRDNVFHRDSRPDEGEYTYAVEAVAYGADVDEIQISGSEIQNHSHAVIAFGLENANVTDLTVTDCTLSDNNVGIASKGYPGDSTLELTAEQTTFENNRVGVVNLENASASDLHIHMCDFQGHTDFAAENRTGSGVLDATCNYWGHPTGPTHESNRPGRGEPVSDGVDYDPLLPQSFTSVSGNACHPAAGNPAEHAGATGKTRPEPPVKGPKNKESKKNSKQ